MSDTQTQVGGADMRRAAAPRGLWALWFVVAALVALVAVPTQLGNRVSELQTRITEVLDEARSMSARISLVKARQMARFEGFLLTGDRAFREPYIAAIAEEDTLFARLGVLARDLDFEVRERLAELRVETTTWHFENQRVFDADSVAGALVVSREGYEELQQRTRELDRAIASEATEGRRAMSGLRRLQSRIMFALAVVALGATVVVARVGWRLRSLTTQSETRRREAVHARREIDALLEATGDGVLGIDLAGKCISLNRAGATLLGYTEREIKGRDVHDTLFHSTADGTPCARSDSPVLTALGAGRPTDSSEGAVLWRRPRSAFPARWSLRPLIDGTELRVRCSPSRT